MSHRGKKIRFQLFDPIPQILAILVLNNHILTYKLSIIVWDMYIKFGRNVFLHKNVRNLILFEVIVSEGSPLKFISQKRLSTCGIWLIITSLVHTSALAESRIIPPQGIIPKSNAEYYSASPNTGTLIPINIWGEVRQPGRHFVGGKSNLLIALSSSGGPLESSDLDPIFVYRGKETFEINLVANGKEFIVQSDDTIIVTRSVKADLPLVFGIISSVVAIATLVFVSSGKE
jgi:hypothetical protein